MSFDLSNIIELGLNHSLLIDDLIIDARKTTPNSAYFAVKGVKFDGHDFIDEAIAAGARVIFSEHSFKRDDAVFIKVANTREMLAIIVNKFYPDKPKNIVAITGTNGKTSVAHFYRQIWYLLGKNAASIGTTGVMINDEIIQNESLTTPDIITLNKLLADIKKADVDYVSQEASSHGLVQNRLQGIELEAAAFTSFSQDHLDYHHSMSDYLDAKILLFSKFLGRGKIVVLNADIKEFEIIKEVCLARSQKIIDYGFGAKELQIKKITNNIEKQIIDFSYLGEDYQVQTDIIGEFQTYNIICALGLAIATGANIRDIINILEKLQSVPGRMQRIISSNIFVDYAHTPDALEQALKLLKSLTKSRLMLVFGCGGDRDALKRPLMGAIADKLADLVVITDDNPRSEDPAKIRKEIITGMNSCDFVEIAGRAEAIKYAISIMSQNDILLIAGKGHEKYQIIGDKIYPFDDVEIAKMSAALKLI
jgi:UDP-N-acetylmuramoyl-L-alanyl-D-glutamate--2,6-diaminopimelate ligase